MFRCLFISEDLTDKIPDVADFNFLKLKGLIHIIPQTKVPFIDLYMIDVFKI